MKKVCAWCSAHLGERASTHESAFPISHGICEVCAASLEAELGGTRWSEFIDSLPFPTLLVTGNVEVKGANQKALELAGKEAGEALDRMGGEVFECVNAADPAGCGRTVHCSGCALRRTISETYRTGEGQVRAPAVLTVHPGPASEQIAFYVTTEKVADRVLVRIDLAD